MALEIMAIIELPAESLPCRVVTEDIEVSHLLANSMRPKQTNSDNSRKS